MTSAGSIECVKDRPHQEKLFVIESNLFVVFYLVYAIKFHTHFLLDTASS